VASAAGRRKQALDGVFRERFLCRRGYRISAPLRIADDADAHSCAAGAGDAKG
jgi:hypothetical protein